MQFLRLPSKTSLCKVNDSKIKNTVEHDVNSVLDGFRNYYLTLAENLKKIPSKLPTKYSINTVFNFYKDMTPSDYFHLASISENSILIILKATQVSKSAGIDNLSGCFLKKGAKFLSKPNISFM